MFLDQGGGGGKMVFWVLVRISGGAFWDRRACGKVSSLLTTGFMLTGCVYHV